jgi:hypothetical protein
MVKNENKWLLEDLIELTVANFYAFDKKTGIEYYSGTLKSHELDSKGDTTKVKGGQQNDVYFTIPQSKELSLKITDIFSRQDIMALKYGDTIHEVGTDVVYAKHMPRNYTVKSDGSALYIKLSNEPATGEIVRAYNNTTKKMIDATKFTVDSVNTQKYIITETGIQEGDTVFVTGFKYKAKATELYSDITSDSRMPELEVVIEVPVFDQSCMDIVMYKQYIFPRAQMNATINSKGESEKKEVNDETTIDILKDSSLDYLGRIVYIYPEDNSGTTIPSSASVSNVTSSVTGEADVDFVIPTGATAITLKYKLSNATLWTNATNTLTDASTTAIITGLTSASKYDFKITYTLSGTTSDSNIVTNVTIA